jgi:hypothetical protein
VVYLFPADRPHPIKETPLAFSQINNNFPSGFRPLMVDYTGAPVSVNQYAKTASDPAIFTWDLVRKNAASALIEGQILPTPAVLSFASGTPGTTLMLGSSLNFGAASTATWHTIMDDPAALFVAQCDSTGTAPTVANAAGKNANVTNTAQTNGTTLSAMQVSTTSIATTAALDLRIRDLYRLLSNVEGANALVEVMILKHQYAQGSAGV